MVLWKLAINWAQSYILTHAINKKVNIRSIKWHIVKNKAVSRGKWRKHVCDVGTEGPLNDTRCKTQMWLDQEKFGQQKPE